MFKYIKRRSMVSTATGRRGKERGGSGGATTCGACAEVGRRPHPPHPAAPPMARSSARSTAPMAQHADIARFRVKRSTLAGAKRAGPGEAASNGMAVLKSAITLPDPYMPTASLVEALGASSVIRWVGGESGSKSGTRVLSNMLVRATSSALRPRAWQNRTNFSEEAMVETT